jgi:rhodanese-related sulfurtransferase
MSFLSIDFRSARRQTGRDRPALPPRPFKEDSTMPALSEPSRAVLEPSAAPASEALAHFEELLRFETDCYDVHEAIAADDPGFVVLDVRAPDLYAAGHVPGAVNLPHRRIVERNLQAYPPDTLFVVYCDGVHCNGADRAALSLARLGRPVKKMIGGVAGWRANGFALKTGA